MYVLLGHFRLYKTEAILVCLISFAKQHEMPKANQSVVIKPPQVSSEIAEKRKNLVKFCHYFSPVEWQNDKIILELLKLPLLREERP